MGSKTRDERRKAERDEENRKTDEVDRLLEEPRLFPFEKPASGKIVKKPADPPKPKP